MNRPANHYFDLAPRLIKTGREQEIVIRPLFDHCRFAAAVPCQLNVVPLEGAAGQVNRLDPKPIPFAIAGGALQFACRFEDEGEYAVLLKKIADKKTSLIAEFRLYALKDDLFGRRPFKGDPHLHSSYSDGRESPAYVAAACRRIGLDWMAVTDHSKYAPSQEAIRAFANAPIDLRIYSGEEVHAPDNPVHIVNFGGKFSVNDLFQTAAYRTEVKAIADTLTGLPPGVNPYTYAACVWCFDKIRRAGGLGVFCHPYWLKDHRYDAPFYLTDLLFARRPFDALEVIAGCQLHEVETNHLQAARYYEEQAQGKKIPVVGASDAHGCECAALFGWYYTVVFAPSPDPPDLIGSIKALYSVAVESLPGTLARAFGPFRLVKYAQFLLREIFPLHDELCVEEGRLMLAHLAGDQTAAKLLALCRGRTPALYNRLWGNRP